MKERKNELRLLIEKLETDINVISEEKDNATQKIYDEDREFEKVLAKNLHLPENYKVIDFRHSGDSVWFEVVRENGAKVLLSSTGYRVSYRIHNDEINLTQNTYSTISSTDTELNHKIKDSELYLSGLNLMSAIRNLIVSYLKSIESSTQLEINLNREIFLMNQKLTKYKNELDRLNLDDYLKENNNMLLFDEKQFVVFRNSSAVRGVTKIEVLKKMPNGDYKVKVYSADLYDEPETVSYITLGRLKQVYSDYLEHFN